MHRLNIHCFLTIHAEITNFITALPDSSPTRSLGYCLRACKKKVSKNTRVYIRLNDDGFLKRHFLRMGALVSHETPGADHQLEHLLDNLFQTNAHPTVTPESVYDFAVIDNTTPSNSTPAYRYAIIIDSAQKQVSDTDCSMIERFAVTVSCYIYT